jgi:hypothetical protein
MTFPPAPGELSYNYPLHEHNQKTDICEEVPILPRCPAKGMLGKQSEDRLHGAKGNRKKKVHDHESRYHWMT